MKRLFFGLLIAVAVVSCRSVQEQTIFIISTNDVHGEIDRIPQLATLIEHYRLQDTAAVIVVDAGDRWTGNPFVDGAQQSGQPIIDLYNMLKYGVATFGNHEFDRGQTVLNDRVQAANFPIIVANMFSTEISPVVQPAPYIIMDIAGTKIAFEGLLTNYNNGYPEGNEPNFDGLNFTDPITAAHQVGNLHKQADVVVALTHIGYDKDTLLANALGGYFDLIIGGHSHERIDTVVNGTVIGQSLNKLKLVGITTIRLRDHKVVSIDYQHFAIDTLPANAVILAAVEHYKDVPYLNEKIGSLATKMEQTGGEVNFFADRIRESLGTDIGLYHIGGVRMEEGVPAGDVQRYKVFMMDSFASQARKMTLTLGEIKHLIISKFNDHLNPAGNSKEANRADIFPSGMTYTILTEGSGNERRAVDVIFEGISPDLNKKYTVAISDYMANNYRFMEYPRTEAYSPLLTDLFEDYFMSHPNFKPDNAVRVSIEPATRAVFLRERAVRTARRR